MQNEVHCLSVPSKLRFLGANFVRVFDYCKGFLLVFLEDFLGFSWVFLGFAGVSLGISSGFSRNFLSFLRGLGGVWLC